MAIPNMISVKMIYLLSNVDSENPIAEKFISMKLKNINVSMIL